jgi:hypothetical protein
LWSPIPIERIEFGLLAHEKQPQENRGFIKMDNSHELEDELRPEYDFSSMEGGVRGKYVDRYRPGTNVILLDPDVARAFPTSKSVNEALRLLMQIARRQNLNNGEQECEFISS